MKIIISHDVDHLYPSDHFFKDFYFLKFWVLTIILLTKKKIGLRIALNRIASIIDKRINNIIEIMEFDRKSGITSTFFFGMSNCLGMSYRKEAAIPYMNLLVKNGFDIGVHGAEYLDFRKINDEYESFKNITNLSAFGIRMHYLRYDQYTFLKLSKAGYLFDSTEYNTDNLFKAPYKIDNMWEFPLFIMDVHIMSDGFEKAKVLTKRLLKKANEENMQFFTFLFHDYLYNERKFPYHRMYYEWFVNHCIHSNYEFSTYKNAIETLTKSNSSNLPND